MRLARFSQILEFPGYDFPLTTMTSSSGRLKLIHWMFGVSVVFMVKVPFDSSVLLRSTLMVFSVGVPVVALPAVYVPARL